MPDPEIRRIGRNGAQRMRQRPDVDAAIGGDLADLQRQEVVAALLGHHRKQRQLAGAVELLGELAVEHLGARRA